MNDLYFIEISRKGEIELYEKEGTFRDHDTQDQLVATFYNEEEAEKILKILNIHYSK